MSVRFAPSPTGVFHVGNLRTAWVSKLWAKTLKMPWVVRFDDIDKPRVVLGAQEKQLADMGALGLVPSQIIVQSELIDRHRKVFLAFLKNKFIYPCSCSRQKIKSALENFASAPHEKAPHYNGHCRNLNLNADNEITTLAWRLKMPNPSGTDDFIIARTTSDNKNNTFTPAYHWATAIDDYDGGYALLVRAWDLEEATLQQRAIQEKLAELEGKKFNPPAVFHTSLVVENNGHRLEKRTKGVTLDELLEKGETPKTILEKFEHSFLEKLVIESSHLSGEPKRQLTLKDLGF